MTLIHPVILCGGGGTRLWPRSRRAHPKPFLPLLGDRTLFQQSLDRVNDAAAYAPPVIVTGKDHRALVEEQCRRDATIIVEPSPRNTAPAIALAAKALPDDAIMLVCPSDHHIADAAAFHEGVRRAVELARDGSLVSFGIEPTMPHTGYGYIKRGEPLGCGHQVASFVEKPDASRAKEFLADGGYVWNGGIFVFQAGRFMDELTTHRPAVAELVERAMSDAERDGGIILPEPVSFAAIEAESVDYAVMENTRHAAVVASDMGWSDIGDWKALHTARVHAGKDGNHIQGPGEALQCRNVMIDTDSAHVSVVGLENIVVVVDGDRVLVTSHDGAQNVGKLKGAMEQ